MKALAAMFLLVVGLATPGFAQKEGAHSARQPAQAPAATPAPAPAAVDPSPALQGFFGDPIEKVLEKNGGYRQLEKDKVDLKDATDWDAMEKPSASPHPSSSPSPSPAGGKDRADRSGVERGPSSAGHEKSGPSRDVGPKGSKGGS
jgi:hypothetical protein